MVRNPFCCLAILLPLLWFTAGTAGGHQLPPEVLLDQLLLRTEGLIELDDLDGAAETMEAALALGEEHDLELPSDVRFEHAQVAFAVGLVGAAKESVTQYLTVSNREAESYLDAVGTLEDADRIVGRRNAPECTPQPEGSPWWMELASHPGLSRGDIHPGRPRHPGPPRSRAAR